MEIPFGNADLNFSESLNNPGNLSDLTNDKYSMGKINNINVYSSPEEGIAALCNALESIQLAGAQKVKDIISGFVDIVGNLIRTRTSYINLRKTAYLEDINNIWGIDPDEVVDLHDPSTKLIFAIVVTELVQKRNIYTYSQFIKGCALSMNMDPKVYEGKVNDTTLSIESYRSSGYNSPTKESIVKGGSSLENSKSSNYEQPSTTYSNYNPMASTHETQVYIKTVDYSLKNTNPKLNYSFPDSQMSDSLPGALTNLGFKESVVIGGEIVYINPVGDKARLLSNQTYLITHASGAEDSIVKAVPTSISITHDIDKKTGILSNQSSIESQKANLDKHISSATFGSPKTTRPLSTAQTILAAFRFR